MKRIKSFAEMINESYPPWGNPNWQKLPQWQLLLLMGFRVVGQNPSTHTVTIASDYSGVNLRLTSSGYVRTSPAGYVFTTTVGNKDRMSQLLEYVITRFAKKGIPLILSEKLDALVKAHPELLELLSSVPKIKEGVMRRTGLSDATESFLAQHGINYQTRKWLDKCADKWELDPKTGLVNTQSSFEAPRGNKLGFRGVKFGHINGNFICREIGLTSLEGAPQEVEGNFICSDNSLTSLKGAPQAVGGAFSCSRNTLTSLQGAPQKVEGNFNCTNNNLTSLQGAPLKVEGDFDCTNNNLTSLQGAPQKVGGNFNCTNNNLTSLQGAPQKVEGDFKCYLNSLTSLKGAPQQVGKSFYCFRNSLTSLQGAPQEVGGNFGCYDNPLASLQGAPIKIGWVFDCGVKIEKWDMKHIVNAFLNATGKQKDLLSTLLTDQELDAYFKIHPTDLYLLDDHPEIKAGILKRTGMKDLSLLGRLSASNMI